MPTLHDFEVEAIDTSTNLVPSLRGKVVLIVNVASECGLTPQYEGLQQLQVELADQDFAVLGMPCNQFGAQEPGSESEIAEFCSTNYQVSFPLSRKIEVNGEGRHPLYDWLTSERDGFPGDIEWNFEKFLIDRDGRIARRYPPATTPQDKGLLQDIADLI